MGRDVLSEKAYGLVASEAIKAGSATHRGEQRKKEGKGLHPLVDPSGYDVIRRSISFMKPQDDKFELFRGVAMLVEDLLDTTGSMGGNVEVAMRVLPTVYKLLATGSDAVLKRYDTQIITGIFGDVTDVYVLQRSQAELDERIAEQMTLMYPEKDGGDEPEDPQYGLFGAAYLTAADINKYGLKSYHFMVGDAPGRNLLDHKTLVRVYGKSVYDKVVENHGENYNFSQSNLPTTKEVVTALKTRAHAFFLQIKKSTSAYNFWTEIYDADHVVMIDNAEQLPLVQAAIIGLTEGTLNLQTVSDFLKPEAGNADVNKIVRAISHIPIGAQMKAPNFAKIPKRGDIFANKGDLWPIEESAESGSKPKKKPGKTSGVKWK